MSVLPPNEVNQIHSENRAHELLLKLSKELGVSYPYDREDITEGIELAALILWILNNKIEEMILVSREWHERIYSLEREVEDLKTEIKDMKFWAQDQFRRR